MPNYQNGKIYMIESLEGDSKYYGSTVQSIALRLAKHRNEIKVGKNPSSKEVLKYQDARILLVQSFPCNSKMELEAKEAEYIRNNECVNKHIPQRTLKQWRIDNKEIIAEKKKEYYQDNKEVIKEYKYKKCLCDCGKEYTNTHYKRHQQSKQHKFYQKTYDFIIS